MSGCESGYIFPQNERQLGDSDFSSHIKFKTVLSTIKELCACCTNRDGPFGTHTCRKTAYLLAIWGGGQIDEIKTSARHADQASAEVYKRDAATLLEYAKRNFPHQLLEVTPKWKPVLVQSNQMARKLNSRNRDLAKPVYTLASIQFKRIFKTAMNHPEYGVKYVLDTAFQYKSVGAGSASQQITDLLDELNANPDQIIRLKGLIDQHACDVRYSENTTQSAEGNL
jgi:hypothetical protein